VEVEKQRQDRELQIAREIQRSLFPLEFPVLPGYAVAAATRPCHEVGGDDYDVIGIGQGRWAIVIADVSGKGVPASILMASLHASLHALAGTADPATILVRLNRFLFESTQPSKFATVFYAELDTEAGRLVYVNGGHVPPYHVSSAGHVSRLEAGGPAVGLLEGMPFEAGSVALAAGDRVVMVTDGATEARSPLDEEFGDERVLATLASHPHAGADATLAALFDDVNAWTGPAGCSDDLTAFVLEVR
jgi:sigma-B regulation protein RsbU (phosphoserine phosphatase)